MYIASQIKYSFWVELRISSEFSILVKGEIYGLHAKTHHMYLYGLQSVNGWSTHPTAPNTI